MTSESKMVPLQNFVGDQYPKFRYTPVQLQTLAIRWAFTIPMAIYFTVHFTFNPCLTALTHLLRTWHPLSTLQAHLISPLQDLQASETPTCLKFHLSIPNLKGLAALGPVIRLGPIHRQPEVQLLTF